MPTLVGTSSSWAPSATMTLEVSLEAGTRVFATIACSVGRGLRDHGRENNALSPKMFMSQPLQCVNEYIRLPGTGESRSRRWWILLDYLGVPNVITKVLMRERGRTE